MMKVGVPLKDVYAAAVNVVKSKKPELESSFVKSIGFAVSFSAGRKADSTDWYRVP